MDSTKECISILKDNAPDIKKLFGVKSLCLFGSFSRSEQREDSDVDVFVEMEPKIFIMVRLKRFLEEKLQRQVCETIAYSPCLGFYRYGCSRLFAPEALNLSTPLRIFLPSLLPEQSPFSLCSAYVYYLSLSSYLISLWSWYDFATIL